MIHKLPVIKIVGVSACGKSTLVRLFRELGYDARAISQEHSQVATLWKRFEVPRVLIYLDTTLEAQRLRRPDGDWTEAALTEERRRLHNAYAEADLRINNAQVRSEEVLAMTLAYLRAKRIRHAGEPLPEAGATGAPIEQSGAAEDLKLQGRCATRTRHAVTRCIGVGNPLDPLDEIS